MQCNPNENLKIYFQILKNDYKVYIKRKNKQNSQNNLERKTNPAIQLKEDLSYRKEDSDIGEDIQMNQWNIIERPQIDPHKYNQLIFDKAAKVI